MSRIGFRLNTYSFKLQVSMYVQCMCACILLFLAAGSHRMPRFWARLWDSETAIVHVDPYCTNIIQSLYYHTCIIPTAIHKVSHSTSREQ